jgi:hypothetical protein
MAGMSEVRHLLDLVGVGVHDRELLDELGKAVVNVQGRSPPTVDFTRSTSLPTASSVTSPGAPSPEGLDGNDIEHGSCYCTPLSGGRRCRRCRAAMAAVMSSQLGVPVRANPCSSRCMVWWRETSLRRKPALSHLDRRVAWSPSCPRG